MPFGIFGDLFDFDGDGQLNPFELAAEFALVEELEKEEEDKSDSEDSPWL